MILHSIVSLRDIFCNRDELPASPEYRRIPGGMVEVLDGRIRRLISTDPRMYLDRRYSPDTSIGKR